MCLLGLFFLWARNTAVAKNNNRQTSSQVHGFQLKVVPDARRWYSSRGGSIYTTSNLHSSSSRSNKWRSQSRYLNTNKEPSSQLKVGIVFLYYNPRLELFCWNTSSTQLKVDIVFCTTIPDHNYRKILKISQGAYIFQRPFLRDLVLEGLMYWGKIAFRNWLGWPYSWK